MRNNYLRKCNTCPVGLKSRPRQCPAAPYIHILTRSSFKGRSAYELPEWPEGERPSDNSRAQDRAEAADLTDEESRLAGDYVQLYNIRGHPENPGSRTNARRARRAQNDVLATVGVCVSTDKSAKSQLAAVTKSASDGPQTQKITQIIKENECGYWLSMSHDVASYVLQYWLVCLRDRLQVYISIEHICVRRYLANG